jgi:hypothetical protein
MLDVRASRPRPHLTQVTALALAAVLAAAGAALAVGCGGNDSGSGRKLSQAKAASLQATLDQVEQDVSARDCTSAGQETGTLREQIGSLKRVSRELRSALEASAARLQSLVENQCAATPAPAVEPQGETGATGATGEAGPKANGKKKGHPKEKKAKDKVPPGEQLPPDQQGNGGGAGLPGESHSGGGD